MEEVSSRCYTKQNWPPCHFAWKRRSARRPKSTLRNAGSRKPKCCFNVVPPSQRLPYVAGNPFLLMISTGSIIHPKAGHTRSERCRSHGFDPRRVYDPLRGSFLMRFMSQLDGCVVPPPGIEPRIAV